MSTENSNWNKPLIVKIRPPKRNEKTGRKVIAAPKTTNNKRDRIVLEEDSNQPHQWFIVLHDIVFGDQIALMALANSRILENDMEFGDVVDADTYLKPNKVDRDSLFWIVAPDDWGNYSEFRDNDQVNWLAGETEFPAWMTPSGMLYKMLKRLQASSVDRLLTVEAILPPNLGELTRQTIDALLKSANMAAKGKSANGAGYLKTIEDTVQKLELVATCFEALADMEAQKAVANLEQAARDLGNLLNTQAQTEQAIKDLSAKLTGLSDNDSYYQKEITEVSSQIVQAKAIAKRHLDALNNTLASINAAHHEVSEAMKWCWVPVYGQIRAAKAVLANFEAAYRGTKSLVDFDSVVIEDMQSDIEAFETSLGNDELNEARIRTQSTQLQDRVKVLNAREVNLKEHKTLLQHHKRALIDRQVFFRDMALFWGEVSVALKSDVGKKIQRAEIIAKALKGDMTTKTGVRVSQALKCSLIDFADHVDGKSSDHFNKDAEDIAQFTLAGVLKELHESRG